MTNLLELAERVEGAASPDRELDALIWCALNGKRYVGHNEAYAAYGAHSPKTQVEFCEPPKRARLVTGRPSLPHAMPVTSSLDAALLLVPEGVGYQITDLGCGGSVIVAMVRLGQAKISASAATPALALTAAALRAIAAQGDGK